MGEDGMGMNLIMWQRCQLSWHVPHISRQSNNK